MPLEFGRLSIRWCGCRIASPRSPSATCSADYGGDYRRTVRRVVTAGGGSLSAAVGGALHRSARRRVVSHRVGRCVCICSLCPSDLWVAVISRSYSTPRHAPSGDKCFCRYGQVLCAYSFMCCVRQSFTMKFTTDSVVPFDESNQPDSTTPLKATRRLIKVDFSAIEDDDDEEDLSDGGSREPDRPRPNPWHRTAYDLATQCPSRRASMRRHTIVVCEPSNSGSVSVPQSRPASRQTASTPSDESIAGTLPEMSWSRSSLQDDLLHSKTWQEECLSLTLEEIVHIRSVLTKAELESLPVEGHVKEDAEKRKVCFLCMKTRFSIFGPWGQICKLCKRTVCNKCYSKMRIPTEHFSHVPVVALSPGLLSPDSDDSFPRALYNRLVVPDRKAVGSAPSSPKINRSAPPSQMSTSMISDSGHQSLPPTSTMSTPTGTLRRFTRSKTLGRPEEKAEKLKGLEMIVCHDCKTMVIQIIKSSRTSRNNAIRNLTLDLSPVY